MRLRLHPLAAAAAGAAAATAVALIPVRRLDLDLSVNLLRHRVQTVPEPPSRIVVITLGPEDQRALAANAGRPVAGAPNCPSLPPAPDFLVDPISWRRQHACLLDALQTSGLKVVAFDINFVRDVPGATREFRAAVERARHGPMRVVLGHPGGEGARLLTHALYAAGTPAGITEAWIASRRSLAAGTMKRFTLMRELTASEGRTEVMPGLSVQAYALHHGHPARFASRAGQPVFEHPAGISTGALWLRYPERAVTAVRYSDVVLSGPGPSLPELHGKDVAFVGVVGAWAERLHDLHTLPVTPVGQPALAADGRLPGVFVHAYALHQLERQAGVFEPPFLGAVLIAFVAGVAPTLAIAGLSPPRFDVYRGAEGGSPWTGGLARARWLVLVPLVLLGPAIALVERFGLMLPVVSMTVTTIVASTLMAVPALRSGRAARRFAQALERIVRLQPRSRLPALVRVPTTGIDGLRRSLAAPALSDDAVARLCELLHACFVEADAGKTFFQCLPRRFFQMHGWLPPGAVDAPALDQPVAKADELAETFIGTEVRRIRNLIHPELRPHPRMLGHAAKARHTRAATERVGASAALAAQRSLMRAATDYVDKLALWLDREITQHESRSADLTPGIR